MTNRKPPGYWKKEENTIAEARQIMEEQAWKVLPSDGELRKHGYNPLGIAITKYQGGFRSFRKKLGQTNTTKPNGYWKVEENVIAEAQQAIADNNWDALPSQDMLQKKGYSSLSRAINKYHGGIQEFRATHGQKNTTKPQGYWKSLDNALAEAQLAMTDNNWDRLPSHGQLIKHGYNSLSHAIRYHGGYLTFRKKLGQTNPEKPKGYWKSLDNTIKEVQQAIEKQEWITLPSKEMLAKYGYHSLNYAISKYYGGIPNFRKLLTEHETGKTQKQQLEELLDEYIAA